MTKGKFFEVGISKKLFRVLRIVLLLIIKKRQVFRMAFTLSVHLILTIIRIFFFEPKNQVFST